MGKHAGVSDARRRPAKPGKAGSRPSIAPARVRWRTGRSRRISWPDGTRVDVYLTAKAPRKTQVAVQHTKLPDPDAVAMRKAFWKEALDRLGERLAR